MGVEEDLRFEERVEAEIQRETRALRGRIDAMSVEKKELEKMLGLYVRLGGAALAPPTWTVSPGVSEAHEGIVVAQLTDAHWDELVKPEEIFFLNAYSREIAVRRFRTWAEKVVTLPRDYMKGVDIAGLAILATGDLFTGEIHAELKESNADALYASVIFWVEHAISALELLEKEYGQVSLSAVVGNHGRSTIKPVFKGRAHSNIEWLFWRIVESRMGDRGSKISFNVSDAMDLNVQLYDRNYLITHGDQFKGGTGISGAYAPLSLGQHRKATRQMAAGMPMEMMVIGHMHQILDLPGVIMGGSIKGYDEFAFGLNLRPETAAQALWLTTPERGKTIFMPVILQDREEEGW